MTCSDQHFEVVRHYSTLPTKSIHILLFTQFTFCSRIYSSLLYHYVLTDVCVTFWHPASCKLADYKVCASLFVAAKYVASTGSSNYVAANTLFKAGRPTLAQRLKPGLRSVMLLKSPRSYYYGLTPLTSQVNNLTLSSNKAVHLPNQISLLSVRILVPWTRGGDSQKQKKLPKSSQSNNSTRQDSLKLSQTRNPFINTSQFLTRQAEWHTRTDGQTWWYTVILQAEHGRGMPSQLANWICPGIYEGAQALKSG